MKPENVDCQVCGNSTQYGMERYEDGEISILSCCGGCTVANDVKYCCFCGAKL